MNWKIKALLQKGLALTKLGDKLNHLPVTFNKKYHQNVFLYQTHECLRKFSHPIFRMNGSNTKSIAQHLVQFFADEFFTFAFHAARFHDNGMMQLEFLHFNQIQQSVSYPNKYYVLARLI